MSAAAQPAMDDMFAVQPDPDLEIFEDSEGRQYVRRSAITDAGLAHFREPHPCEPITKHDVFYYVYGILHSPEYRERYANNLRKELPRIPRCRVASDFWRFSRAGRELGDLHVNYESVPMYTGCVIDAPDDLAPMDYCVQKMRFAKTKDPQTGKPINDRSTVIYNDKITIRNIPAAAWGYCIESRPALAWVMDRQGVRTDKASGIVNDANDWAIETTGNPKYPLELFLRVVTVSLETMRIVAALPALDLYEGSE